MILVAAGVVSYLSLRDPKLEPRGALPLCLLVFALLFDLSVTTDRLFFGLALSVTSRYTMANLLLPLGLIAYGWSRLPRGFHVQPTPDSGHRDRRACAARSSLSSSLCPRTMACGRRCNIER